MPMVGTCVAETHCRARQNIADLSEENGFAYTGLIGAYASCSIAMKDPSSCFLLL